MYQNQPNESNVVQIAKIGAKIQKFKSHLWACIDDFKTSVHADDDMEIVKIREAKEEMLYSLLDEYSEIFDDILM